MLHAHALREIARALTAAKVDALLVKGAALALTVYADPAARPMADIDLLVREGDSDRVVAALVAAGCTVRPEPGRAHSAPLMGETALYLHAGAMTELVEVHTSLSKAVDRPAAGLFERASPAPALPGLLVPADEDHTLLIALHAAGHDFTHPLGFLDLELLLRRGLDVRVLVERARAWKVTGVMFAMLSAMQQLGAASVTEELVAAFDPGPLRRELLRHAAARGPLAPGLGWFVAQIPLRDDPVAWLGGAVRYAAARAKDRGWLGSVREGDAEYRVPAWIRAILALDRTAERAGNVLSSVRDEAILAWVPPSERAALTAAVYADLPSYLPGGSRFQRELFGWEERILALSSFPKSGRVLIGGAGPGRELVAFVERGFRAVAFDPCLPFVEAARSLVPADKADVVHASYADLVDAVAGRGGPLLQLAEGPPFDAVVLGWGSLSHVMPAAARVELLRALPALCPKGPVLASFALVTEAPPAGSPAGSKGRVRNGLRRAFAALGAPGVSEDRDHFLASTGFFAYLTRPEVTVLAGDAGYEIARFEEAPYPHVLLVPLLDAKLKRGTASPRKPRENGG